MNKSQAFQELESVYAECHDRYKEQKNHILWALVDKMYKFINPFKNYDERKPEIKPVKVDTLDEWLSIPDFLSLYGEVFTLSTIQTFIRFGDDADFIQGSKFDHNIQLNPRRLFVYVYQKKSKFSRINARLSRENYFGAFAIAPNLSNL